MTVRRRTVRLGALVALVAASVVLEDARGGPLGAVPTAQPTVIRHERVLQPGDQLSGALAGLGAAPESILAATAALGEVADTVNRVDPQALSAETMGRTVTRLSLRGPDGGGAVAYRLPDGRYYGEAIASPAQTRSTTPPAVIAAAPEPARDEVSAVEGPIEDLLYGDALPPGVVLEVARLFAHKLDLARDLALGDTIRLVVRKSVDQSGRTVRAEPIYVQFDGVAASLRLYRMSSPWAKSAQWVDDNGQDLRGGLLRTPLDQARVTSGFGLRLHPLLGYTRMHQGVDFGAANGTPVLAAADGVVGTVGWSGGYGRLVRITHAGDVSTSYAHLSGWSSGLRAGTAVKQGQVIGFVGASGLATGPHLHYEVRRGNQAIDPRGVTTLRSSLSAADRESFRARKLEVANAFRKRPAISYGRGAAG